MTAEQHIAYQWALTSHYASVAAQYANTLAHVVSEQAIELTDLRAQLAESEKREKAAVKDIMCKDHCDVCVCGKDADGECGTNDFDCLTCKSKTCMCRTCRNEDKWQWRGLTVQKGNK